MSTWIDYEIQREFTDWADLCDRHNAEVDELRAKLEQVRSEVGCARGQRTTQFCAEAAEYKRRLDAVVKMLEPDKMARKYVEGCEATTKAWDAAQIVHARAVAIAEGRDNLTAEQSAAAINAMINDPGDTPEEWLYKLKSLRGKECTYGNVSFSECSYCQSELARAVAIAEGRDK